VPKSVDISEACLSFVSACLQNDVKKRIGWKEMHKHPFLQNEESK
jgi:serine/threonine protein kinase